MVLPDFLAVLRSLREGEVDFILVGGFASVLNGAPVHTYDVDIVPAQDEVNLERLLRVTKFGYLDVLGAVGSGLAYEDLLPHTIEMELGDLLRTRVLDLATIIAVKEQVGGEKDLLVLPILRRVLQEKNLADRGSSH